MIFFPALVAGLHALHLAAATVASAEAGAPESCATAIRSVLAEIAARDLDTSQGPPLNAFLSLNPHAVAQAEALDHRTAAGAPRGPLFCVPVAVQDNFDTYDLPTTAGSLALLDNQPPRDAPFVARLREAGAIVVGKTNMDEFGMGLRGVSGAGGRVGNAYDTTQSPGGAASGSGAAVGAGLVPLSVASDTCGSLRVPAAYNGAVALRATYGRFDTSGIFPIGFVNLVPGVIARDTSMLRTALAVAGDGWRGGGGGGLRGMRIGVLRRFNRSDPWGKTDASAQGILGQAIAVLRRAGAEIVDRVALDNFDTRRGTEFLKGFARRVDASFGSYPAGRRNWRDVCTSGRIRPEWSARECEADGAPSSRLEEEAEDRIADNRRATLAVLDKQRLDALLYPVDGRGGARGDVSRDITCFIAGSSGLPAIVLPVALDARGMPVAVELMGRPYDDEALVGMAAAFEAARGPFPQPQPIAAREDLGALDIAGQNELRRQLGWAAFRSRRGKDIGALAPDKFRALTEETVNAAMAR
jgi:amidase